MRAMRMYVIMVMALALGAACNGEDDRVQELDEREQVDVAPHSETPAAERRGDEPDYERMDSDTIGDDERRIDPPEPD